MEKYKKLHQIYLHYLLSNHRLSTEEYNVITSLTESEVKLWFSPSRSKIIRLVNLLGSCALCQFKTHSVDIDNWLRYQNELTRNQYLWSKTLGIKFCTDFTIDMCRQTLGFALLSAYNPRNALIWALRLRRSVPVSSLTVQCSVRLAIFISIIAKDCNIDFAGVYKLGGEI